MNKINVLFDMETNDPDDFFALCILTTHPAVNLKAVTVTPGSRYQIGIVKHLLKIIEREDVKVGSRNPDYPKKCVSDFHYKFLGDIPPKEPDDLAYNIMAEVLTTNADTTLITGSPLACCIAIEPTIATFMEVECYENKREWGSKPKKNTNTFITIDIDIKKFYKILTGDCE